MSPQWDARCITSSKKVAVLLAAYNGKQYLEEQLVSVANQTMQDFICCIHDDGSTDGTQELAERFCDRHPDHFRYLGSGRTGGAKYNFHWLLAHVEAQYYMFCDQDDVWKPEKAKELLDLLQGHENCRNPLLVYSDLAVVDERLHVMDPSFFHYTGLDPHRNALEDLLNANVAPGCTMLFNRAARERFLAADVMNLISMHDWYLLLLCRCTGEVFFTDKPLVFYRQHNDNTLGAAAHTSVAEKVKKYAGAPGSFFKNKRKHLDESRNNAKALLQYLETAAAGYEDEKAFLKRYIRGHERILPLRLLAYYKWMKMG